MAKGYLIVNVYGESIANPIKNASINILKDNNLIYTGTTDESGKSNIITLDTVGEDYSLEEQYQVRPYETYELEVSALGMTPTRINGVQIFDNITSYQNVYLTSLDENNTEDTTNISPNSLWENKEDQSTTNINNDTGIAPIILKEVVVPQNIIVHDGTPSNRNAPNYTVAFTDYIKNVASGEIYSTWPEETIKANVLAIISFTLNRIYTEWYRSLGYNFTITSSPSYDQKYTRNGTIFEPISKVVDEIFNKYIRNGVRMEPLLAQYRSNTSESGYLSQWGSKDLGDKGYNALQILKYYYGNNINLYDASVSTNYPYSFTSTLKYGDCNSDVYLLQSALNYIHGSYPAIPLIDTPTGYYGNNTINSVKAFQKIFNLNQTGEVDFDTWYKISYILTATQELNKGAFS